MLNAQEAVPYQNSLVSNVHRFLAPSLQKSTKYLLTHVLNHVRAAGLEYCTNTYGHCGVIACTAHTNHKSISRVIAEGRDPAWSLPAFGGHDNSAVGGSSSTSGNGRSSSCETPSMG